MTKKKTYESILVEQIGEAIELKKQLLSNAQIAELTEFTAKEVSKIISEAKKAGKVPKNIESLIRADRNRKRGELDPEDIPLKPLDKYEHPELEEVFPDFYCTKNFWLFNYNN